MFWGCPPVKRSGIHPRGTTYTNYCKNEQCRTTLPALGARHVAKGLRRHPSIHCRLPDGHGTLVVAPTSAPSGRLPVMRHRNSSTSAVSSAASALAAASFDRTVGSIAASRSAEVSWCT